jgi:hypothetical protein
VLRRLPTGTPATREQIGGGPVTTIVVKRDGAVAWIVEAEAPPPGKWEVHAVETNGSRVLASGADVAPWSLALAGNNLYWTQDGRASAAPLN